MADHTENVLHAAAQSLRDVVAPALDDTNPLAKEQLQLVADWLDFLRERLPVAFDRQRCELEQNLTLGETLLPKCPSDNDDLPRAIEQGREVLARCSVRAHELRDANDDLTDSISGAVKRVRLADAQTARDIEVAVLESTRSFLELQRSWFLPLSPEPDPAALPELARVLEGTQES